MRRAVATGLLVSLGIETLQLVGSLTVSPGRIFDVDDLQGNTFGTGVGYATFSLLAMIPFLARVLDQPREVVTTD